MKKLYILLGTFVVLVCGSVAHAQLFTSTSTYSLQITPSALPNGTVGASYMQTLAASSTATGPFSWTISSGALPPGLYLASSTGNNALVSGTPTTAGQYDFTVNATNNINIASTQTYVVNINAIDVVVPVATTTTTTTTVSASTTADLQAELNLLTAQLLQLEASVSAPTSTGSVLGASTGPIFARNLTIGSVGADVTALQRFLNNNGYQVASSGPGSPGSESDYFGPLTQKALASWQAAQSISPASGYYGPITRGQIGSQLSAGSTSTNY